MGFSFLQAGPTQECRPASGAEFLCGTCETDAEEEAEHSLGGWKGLYSGLRHTSSKCAAKHTLKRRFALAARKSQAGIPPFVGRRRVVRPRAVRRDA